MFWRTQLRPLLQQCITVLLVIGAITCIVPAEVFSGWAKLTDWIILGYLGLGIICLVLNQKRLMVVSLACCTAMCLSKIESTQQQGPKPIPTNQIHEHSFITPDLPILKYMLDVETSAKF